MKDYVCQVDMLRTWNEYEVRRNPALVVGQLRSAASTIERLGAEADRLNLENFWLSRPAEPTPKNGWRTIEVPPVEIGKKAYALRSHGGELRIKSGPVNTIEIEGDRIFINGKGGVSGYYGETVFATKPEAEEALVRMKEEV